MDAIATTPPDLYVIDIGLPGEDGMSLVARIWGRQPLAGIVLLSGQTALNNRIEGYEASADVYVAKPSNLDELLAALRSLARRTVQSRSEQKLEIIVFTHTNQLIGPKSTVQTSDAEKRVLTRFALSPQGMLNAGKYGISGFSRSSGELPKP
jgi:DNA-binding response OmpR family regulator